jgi:hypothetical protein
VKSFDGKYELRLVKTQYKEIDGTLSEALSLVIGVAGIDHKPLRLFHEGQMDCFWGPKESAFAVIRSNGRHGPVFSAFNLKRGKLLRAEYALTVP